MFSDLPTTVSRKTDVWCADINKVEMSEQKMMMFRGHILNIFTKSKLINTNQVR